VTIGSAQIQTPQVKCHKKASKERILSILEGVSALGTVKTVICFGIVLSLKLLVG